MKWPLAKLEDVALQTKGAIVSGPFGSNIGSRFFVDEGVPIIRGNNLTFGHRRFIDEGFVYLTEAKAQEFRNCEAVADDLVFTAAGSIGQVGIIPNDTRFERYIISNKQLRVRCDQTKVSPLFLFLWLTTDEMRQHIIGRNNGGAVPLINLGILRGLPVPLPPKEVQQRIADILSAYDDLMENNRRRMALLEEAARQLYREWFVHLRFPGHEHTRITNGVPEGWERKPFGELLDHEIGGGWGQDEPSGSETEEGYVIRGTDIPEVESGNFSAVGLRYHDPRRLPQRVLRAGDIIFEVSGGSATQAIGRTLLITDEILRVLTPRAICASFCKLFRASDPSLPYFLLRFLRHIRESGELSVFQKQSASALQNFQYQPFLAEQQVLLPSPVLLKEFCAVQADILRQQQILATQSHKLRAAHGLLLPRLMSGEIAV